MAGGYNQSRIIQIFLCCMAGIYLFAFTSIYKQIPGLYGENGIYPAAYILEDKSLCEDSDENCPKWAAAGHCSINPWMISNCAKSCNACKVGFWKFLDFPTFLWITPYLGLTTETGMEFICVIGISVSLSLIISPVTRDCISFFMLWFSYFSLVQVGQVFLYYQWDSLLLEAGFLAILIAPWNLFVGVWNILKCRRFRSLGRCHDGLTFWLVKWLLFRLMFASGIVKLLWQDEAWWNLTALNWHYESQCIPSPFAWYMQKLPTAFHRFSIVMTYFIEIGVPFLFFAPFRALRIFSFYCQILLQSLIIFTGNYNFFNFLTIVLCLSLLDDEACQCTARNCCIKKAKQDCRVPIAQCHGHFEVNADGIVTDNKEDPQPIKQNLQTTMERFRFDTSAWSAVRRCLVTFAEDRMKVKKLVMLKRIAADRRTKLALKVIKFAIVVAVVFFLLGTTAKWSGMNFNKEDFIRVELTFSYKDFFYATRNSVIWSMALGLFSLSIEIFAAVIRSIIGSDNMLINTICLTRTVVFSVITLWIFGLSLTRFADLDGEARNSLPKFLVTHYDELEKYHLFDSYGLFRSMTGVGGRPEIIIMGGEELTDNTTWQEYNFMYKPGNLYQMPSINAPHQPRLDWQMWFAASEDYSSNIWFIHLCYKLLLGQQEVFNLLGHNEKLQKKPPKYIRSVLYRYHYTMNASSLVDAIYNKKKEKRWWTREYLEEYMPVVEKDDKALHYLLRRYGLIRDGRAMERHSGVIHPFILFVRNFTSVFRTEVLIYLILFKIFVVKISKAWWNERGKLKSRAKLIASERRTRDYIKRYTAKLETLVNRIPSFHIKSKKKDKWTS